MTDAQQYENTVPPAGEYYPDPAYQPPPPHLAGAGDPKAAVGRRIVAAIIDLVILGALSMLVASLFGGATVGGGEIGFQLTGAPALLLFVVCFGYYIAFEGLRGQTPGKMALGVKVVAADGGPPGWNAVVIRTVLRIVDGFFLYLVGLIVMLSSPRKQRLGDMAGKTLVVRS